MAATEMSQGVVGGEEFGPVATTVQALGRGSVPSAPRGGQGAAVVPSVPSSGQGGGRASDVIPIIAAAVDKVGHQKGPIATH